MKNIVIIAGIAVVLLGGIWFARKNNTPETGSSPTPSVAVSVSPSATPTPVKTLQIKTTPKPTKTPGIIFREVKYVDVAIKNSVFTPASVTVTRGDILRFFNNDDSLHTATAVNGAFNTGIIDPGDGYEFNTSSFTPGTYEFKSDFNASMHGTLIVK
jgi:plastocyanin